MTPSIQFHYTTYGDKEKPPLLFLHGFMGNTDEWEAIVPFLSGNFYCIVMDLPGHGLTVVQDKDDYRMEKCAANLIAFLDALNISTCCLVSYSMGGRLAFYLAIFYPERFKKIIVESASPGLHAEHERHARVKHDRKMARQLEALPLNQFLQTWYSQPIFSSLDKASKPYQEMIQTRMKNDSGKLSLSLQLMGAGVQPSLWEMLDQISADVLCIAGEKDAKYIQIAHAAAARCRRAQVTIIADAGHNVHFENRTEYIKQVGFFFKERK
jgi:2-succinyl-6-hydroxy-2,4-cyclohexadiene-1-carboxylate synthase